MNQSNQNPPPLVEVPYIDLEVDGAVFDLYDSDALNFDYLIPGLCNAGLKQRHLSDVGERIARHVHITRKKE